MNARIAKLEALLDRVHARAQEPRPLRAVGNELELDSPSVAPPASAGANDTIIELDVPELDASDLEAPDSLSVEETAAQAAKPTDGTPELINEPTTSAGIGSALPTMEQLGQTVDLDEGEGDSGLELDEPTLNKPTASAPAPVPAAAPAAQASAEPALVAPQTTKRAPLSATPLVMDGSRTPEPAKSFVALLDSSLSL